MISVEEAQKLVYNATVETKVITISLSDSLGYILAEDILASMDLPSFPQSAMDGYAVCGKHITYELVSESAAGDTEVLSLSDGEAARIFTGASVPENSTAVIMQEKVEAQDKTVHIHDEVEEMKNIRPIGEQIHKGQLIAKKGTNINPGTIGMMASFGIREIQVYAKPKIGLLVTGNEIIEAGQNLNYGQIYDSNTHTLKAAIEDKGFELTSNQKVKDDYQETENIIKTYLEQVDVLLISGGISVGDYDFVEDALKQNGVEEIFYKVSQKPGKPLFFGRKSSKFVFALPGNPAAALSCFYIYVLPFLNKMKGTGNVESEHVQAEITSSFTKRAKRSNFLKARYADGKVDILEKQNSSMLLSFIEANALVYIPEEKEKTDANEKVKTYLIN